MDLVQAVRIIDVFILGPAMINIGNKTGGNLGYFVAFSGLATIVFNGITFLNVEQRRKI